MWIGKIQKYGYLKNRDKEWIALTDEKQRDTFRYI